MEDLNKNKQIPATNIYEAWDRLDVVPLPTNDCRYVDCSGARETNVVKELVKRLRLHSMSNKYMHALFTGYRGDGKTTELFRFMESIADKYRPLYFNAEDEFDLEDFRFPDFLLGIARVVFDKMKEEELPLPEKLLQKVANWFAKIIETVECKSSAEIMAEAGTSTPKWFQIVTGKLIATIKTGGEKRKEIRKELDQQLTQLLDHVDKLLATAVEICIKKDGRAPVIIFDNLDRLDPNLAFDLFHTNGRKLLELDCHFVYVIPISLLYQKKLREFEEPIILHMIPVIDRNNKPKDVSISLLKELLYKRFEPEKIMDDPDAIMDKFILTSGGHLRDLVRLFKQACSDAMDLPDEKINQAITQKRINKLCETYQKLVMDNDYDYLIKTYQSKDAASNDRKQYLIFQTVILVYEENGESWSDVHPALVQGKKFNRFLQELNNK